MPKGLEFGGGYHIFGVLYRADVWDYNAHGTSVKYPRDEEGVFGWDADYG